MIDLTFDRPIGAAADAKELEYITALHQTNDANDDSWINGSIEAEDVMHYLMSRYGINISAEQIKKLIFEDLAGGSEDECIDICEIVAMLLIPFLVKTRKGDLTREMIEASSIRHAFSTDEEFEEYIKNVESCNSLVSKGAVIKRVLNIILADSIGSTEPQPVTKELITTIFSRYGEAGLVENEEFIEEMMNDISGGDPDALLDVESFTRALTSDIMLYDIDNENQMSTLYEDVFGEVDENIEEDQNEDGSQNNNNDGSETDPLQNGRGDIEDRGNTADGRNKVFDKIITFSQIDFLTDSMLSKSHLLLAYLAFIFSIFMYQPTLNRIGASITVCDTESFLCTIANSCIRWIFVMAVSIGIGVPMILSITSGNNFHNKSIINVIISFIGGLVFVLLPTILPLPWSETSIDGDNVTFRSIIQYVLMRVIYAFLYIMASANFERILCPNRTKITRLTRFFEGTKLESFLMKIAMSLKTHTMVKNALDLHLNGIDSALVNNAEITQSSTNTLALLNYSKVTEKTETVGGVLWCWKGFITRSLIHREGVMVNSRLSLCNILQFFLVVVLAYYIPSLFILNVYPYLNPHVGKETSGCAQSTFDPDKCFALENGKTSTGVIVCQSIQFEDESCLSEKYFSPLLGNSETSKGYLETLGNNMCEGVINLLEDAGDNIWSIIYEGKDSQKLAEASTYVVDQILCKGLSSFNETLWKGIENATDSVAVPCDVKNEFLCMKKREHKSDTSFQSAIDEVLTSYEEEYKSIIQYTVDCLENYNSNVINDVFALGTSSLQQIFGESAKASWGLLFTEDRDQAVSFDINEIFESWINDILGPEEVDTLLANSTIIDYSKMMSNISTPSIPSVYDIFEVEAVAMDLVRSAFSELNNTLISVKSAIDSNLDILPSYLALPQLEVQSFCENAFVGRDDAPLVINSIGSTKDNYCKAHVAACLATGPSTAICVLGFDPHFKGAFPMYQFFGDKCYESPQLINVMTTKDTILGLYPDLAILNLGLAFSLGIGLLCLVLISTLFIPNVILTTLKYRSGVLPTLRSKNFRYYRTNLIYLTFLVPSVFWSALAMVFVIMGIISFLVLAFVLPVTRQLMLQGLTFLIAISFTLVLKKIIMYFIESYTFAFYRRNPAMNNVATIAFECWNVFLAIPLVISRVFKLILIALFFIGRIDRPFLADDIIGFDMYPHTFRKAILAAEAHRHPYIERLGMMYLMKLKHGDKFGKRSSSTWRLLFVFALMPWLQKYRIHHEKENDSIEAPDDESKELEEKIQENEQLKRSIAELKALNLQLIKKSNDDGENNGFEIIENNDNSGTIKTTSTTLKEKDL